VRHVLRVTGCVTGFLLAFFAEICDVVLMYDSLSDKSVKDYAVYKPYLMFYALTTSIISVLFKVDL
jgi:hypothetical protein